MKNPRYFDNSLSTQIIADMAWQLVGDIGIGWPDYAYFEQRSQRGWCAAEIARAYVRREYAKGSPERRRALAALSRFGAPQAALS